MSVRCFLLVATDDEWRWLRRFAEGGCSTNAGHYHNAMAYIGRAPALRNEQGYGIEPAVDRADTRWPTTCACGYAFAETDHWQVFSLDIYRRADGLPGEYSIHPNPSEPAIRAAAGAMWDAWWHWRKGPDGHAWTVMLPDGSDWCIDGPSSNGDGWRRSGEAPNLTARPSILTPAYHGWLTNGELTSC